jgi:hypothetical protein
MKIVSAATFQKVPIPSASLKVLGRTPEEALVNAQAVYRTLEERVPNAKVWDPQPKGFDETTRRFFCQVLVTYDSADSDAERVIQDISA